MHATARSVFLCSLFALMLAGCGSSPPVQYYALSSSGSAELTNSDGARTMGLGPLRIPGYLNRSQIVTRSPGAELQVDEFNRWAEPLGLAMHRVVAADVDGLLDELVVIAFPHDAVVGGVVDFRLRGDILRFDADRSGSVVLEVQWSVSSDNGTTVVPAHRARYEAQAGRAGDPDAVVTAMNEALRQFSRDIADAMASVL